MLDAASIPDHTELLLWIARLGLEEEWKLASVF